MPQFMDALYTNETGIIYSPALGYTSIGFKRSPHQYSPHQLWNRIPVVVSPGCPVLLGTTLLQSPLGGYSGLSWELETSVVVGRFNKMKTLSMRSVLATRETVVFLQRGPPEQGLDTVTHMGIGQGRDVYKMTHRKPWLYSWRKNELRVGDIFHPPLLIDAAGLRCATGGRGPLATMLRVKDLTLSLKWECDGMITTHCNLCLLGSSDPSASASLRPKVSLLLPRLECSGTISVHCNPPAFQVQRPGFTMLATLVSPPDLRSLSCLQADSASELGYTKPCV
ncbi:hypothetical protein AAY473_010030 [Plecturocebus cupreus]